MKISIFGESHGPVIGINIKNPPPGILIDDDFIREELKRRAPKADGLSTARVEADLFEFVSGVFNKRTTGAPIVGIIRNTNTISGDYERTKDLMRPSHADFVAHEKFLGFNDYRGGGHFSGRLTAAWVLGGAVAKLVLKEKGIYVGAHIKSIYDVEDLSFNPCGEDRELFEALRKKDFPVLDDGAGEKMKQRIRQAKDDLDSIGGVIECMGINIPLGLGGYDLDSCEGVIARYMFAIGAVKGIEFGLGFGFKNLKGSEANDAFYMDDGVVRTKTNNNGGINGGFTNSMPVIFRVVVKPTPSIYKEQDTINMKTRENAKLQIKGRHDPCIAHRAVPVIESAFALALCELLY